MKNNKISVIGISGLSIFMKCDHFPNPGETGIMKSFHIEYGGKGYNQAIAIKRMNKDTEVSFLTAFGDDDIKDQALSLLYKENINVFPIIKKGKQSAAATILIDKNGQNIVNCFSGASLDLTKEDVQSFEEEIAESKYLLLQLESSDESLIEAVKLAKKHHTKVILNPAPYHDIPQEVLDNVYLLTPNEVEVLGLSPKGINEINDNVIVTLGSKGAMFKENNQLVNIPAPLVNTVNTTGAGDTFNGILAEMLLEGYKLKEAITLAVKGASISVTKEYVIDSIPYREEVL